MSIEDGSVTGGKEGRSEGGLFNAPPQEEWIERYGDTLFRMAMAKVRDGSLAEDLVQETFLAGIRSLAAFKGESPFEGWLRTILSNKIIDHYRNLARDRKLAVTSEQLQGESPSGMSILGFWNVFVSNWGATPEKTLSDVQFRGVVKECIDKLPSVQRTVFLLKFIKEATPDEICKEAGISPSNSWVIVHRARLALRSCIEKNWVKRR